MESFHISLRLSLGVSEKKEALVQNIANIYTGTAANDTTDFHYIDVARIPTHI